jgi:cytochrome c oxidase subunit 5b
MNLSKKAAFASNTRRTLFASVIRCKEYEMPDPIEHATGLEKHELQQAQAGNDNPFDTYVIRPEPDTGLFAKRPILIPSMKDSRIVGCCCEADYEEIVWFNLKAKSGVQRCDCGYYFKLFKQDPLDPKYKPKYGRGVGSGMSPYF